VANTIFAGWLMHLGSAQCIMYLDSLEGQRAQDDHVRLPSIVSPSFFVPEGAGSEFALERDSQAFGAPFFRGKSPDENWPPGLCWNRPLGHCAFGNSGVYYCLMYLARPAALATGNPDGIPAYNGQELVCLKARMSASWEKQVVSRATEYGMLGGENQQTGDHAPVAEGRRPCGTWIVRAEPVKIGRMEDRKDDRSGEGDRYCHQMFVRQAQVGAATRSSVRPRAGGKSTVPGNSSGIRKRGRSPLLRR
jgi:hypothetical protein